MAEIVKTSDATTRDADGWLVYYSVRRDDGEEVFVEAHCTGTAEVAARNYENRESLAYIADRGQRAALEFAERAQSPKSRGKTIVRLGVDVFDGSLRRDYDYELPIMLESD